MEPNYALKKPMKKPVKITLGISFGFVLIIIISVLVGNDPAEHKNDSPSLATTQGDASQLLADAATSLPDTSGMLNAVQKSTALFASADEFKNAFNRFSSLNSFDYEIDKMKFQEGEVQNSFQCSITKTVAVVGSINKSDGTIRDVMLFGKGDGTSASGLDILTCMTSVIAIIDPTLEPKQRLGIINNLGLLGDQAGNVTDLSNSTDLNGIHYSLNSNDVTGLMFGASR